MPADRRRPASGTGLRGLAVFLAVPLLVLAAVSIGTAAFSERLARSNALAGAEASAVRMTRYLIKPVLEQALAGDARRWTDLDLRVQNRLADGSPTTVIIWEAPARVWYASDLGVVGQGLPPTEQLRTAAAGRLVAQVDDRPPQGQPGARGGPLLEVYVPLQIGERSMTVAAFYGYEGIQRQTALLRGQIIPVAVGALVVLQLIQVPIGVTLFRRVRRQDAGRADLLARSLTASERERKAIAADVHDGPVQDLAGVAYALAALRPRVPVGDQPGLDELGASVRDAVGWLRQLMTELDPPDEAAPSDLPAALAQLATSARSETVDVAVDIGDLPRLAPETAAALYRTAKQVLDAAAGRPGRHRMWVHCGPATLRDEPAVQLRIGDDGDPGRAGGRATRDGEDELVLIGAQVAEVGGTLDVVGRWGLGPVLTAVVPAQS